MMLEWIDLVWEPATEGQRAMLVLDSFSAHITPAVKQKLKSINTVPLVIPGGCTSKIQPLDVSLNKPFKSYVRKYWSDFVLQQATNLQKLKPPTKQNVAKWVSTALDELQEKPDMVVSSFEACGILPSTNARPTELLQGQLCDDSQDEEDPFNELDNNVCDIEL